MHLLFDTALMAPVRGWLARAERLLESQPETPASAWLAVVRTYERMLTGDLPSARPWARRAIELGSRLDPAACALGRVAEARLLILDGDVRKVCAARRSRGGDRLGNSIRSTAQKYLIYCELVCALQGLAQYDVAEWTGAIDADGARRMPSGAASKSAAGESVAMPGVYISYPFCAQKCTYCNFASGVFPEALAAQYIEKLRAEIRATNWRWTPETVYLGGGTPSQMNPATLASLLDAIPGRPWLESTIEAAPGSITPEKAAAWRRAGIDRVSLGVQSFIARELARTGRKHTAEVVESDVAVLRNSGIHAIDIDLIAGLPGQRRAGKVARPPNSAGCSARFRLHARGR